MRITVSFVAPIPVGAEALIVWTEESGLLGGWSECDPLVVDRTSGILYGPGWTPTQLHAGDLEIEKYTESHRRSPDKPPVAARVKSCLVVTRGEGKYNHMSTVLGLDPLP